MGGTRLLQFVLVRLRLSQDPLDRIFSCLYRPSLLQLHPATYDKPAGLSYSLSRGMHWQSLVFNAPCVGDPYQSTALPRM